MARRQQTAWLSSPWPRSSLGCGSLARACWPAGLGTWPRCHRELPAVQVVAGLQRTRLDACLLAPRAVTRRSTGVEGHQLAPADHEFLCGMCCPVLVAADLDVFEMELIA